MIPQYVKDKEKGYIVESDLSENDCIKFSNGTMIYYNPGIYVDKGTNKYTFNFPIAFKNIPTVLLTNKYSYVRDVIWSIGNVKKSSVDLYPRQNNNTPTETVSVSLIAIGKWK